MDKVLVKRVIGLPGETISAHNDDIYIDGKELAQPWLPKHDPNTNTPAFGPISIPANNYFVMGDKPDHVVRQPVVGHRDQVRDHRQGRDAHLATRSPGLLLTRRTGVDGAVAEAVVALPWGSVTAS